MSMRTKLLTATATALLPIWAGASPSKIPCAAPDWKGELKLDDKTTSLPHQAIAIVACKLLYDAGGNEPLWDAGGNEPLWKKWREGGGVLEIDFGGNGPQYREIVLGDEEVLWEKGAPSSKLDFILATKDAKGKPTACQVIWEWEGLERARALRGLFEETVSVGYAPAMMSIEDCKQSLDMFEETVSVGYTWTLKELQPDHFVFQSHDSKPVHYQLVVDYGTGGGAGGSLTTIYK